MNRTTMVSMLSGFALAMFAAPGTLAYTPSDIAWLTTSMTSGDPTAWPTSWQIDGGATVSEIDSTQDYGVKDAKQFRPKIGTSTFAGKSFSIGALDRSTSGSLVFRTTQGDCDTTFANDGLFLHYGTIQCWNAYSQSLRGKVTVRSPASAPFTITFTAADAALSFLCPVEGDAASGLYLHSLLASSTTQNQTNLVCRFQRDALSAFYGEMTFCPVATNLKDNASAYSRDYNSKCKPPYFVTFKPDSGTMPGTLTLYPGAIVAPESATNDFSVSSLNVVSLGWSTNYLDVSISADASTCSVLRVTSSLSLSTPMVVRPKIALAASKDRKLDYGDLHLFAATNAAAAMRLAVLKAPSGATLDASLFSLDCDDTLPHLPLYDLDVATDTADGLSTLWLVRKPVVWTTASDTSSTTGFTGGERWSDGDAPSPANDYVLLAGHQLRTMKDTSTTEYSFPGGSLTLVSNALVYAMSPVIRFDDLRVFKQGLLSNISNPATSLNLVEDGPGLGTFVLNGLIRIHTPMETAADKTAFQVRCFANKGWTINAEISGKGTVYFNGGYPQNNVVDRNGWCALLGWNTNYYGTVHVHNYSASSENDWRTHLLINDPRNLGAPLPSFQRNALVLDVNCALRPLASITLEDDNRGISMAGSRTYLTIDSGLTFTCRKRINHGGGVVVKDGAGELALGGGSPTFAGAATPTASKNILDIREGTLCPISAEAFQGLAVVITNGATLAVNVPASNTDGGIGQYGMLDTSWDAPITVPASGLTVQVRDPNGVLNAGSPPRYVPVCTVNATAYADLNGKLSVAGLSNSGYIPSPVWLENEDGTYTFAATLRKGTVIIMR